jgi:redox-sensitive bicupin YhaK (pirin superfamily)
MRTLKQVIRSIPASDGAGVKLRRSLGQSNALRLDPYLMLDEFSSEDAADYIAGFPNHPHRGFETVTYILDGHMLHEDHLGNKGNLKSGGVQWMTAGRGIIHSEMPQQESGRMRGFQLWLNLPAKEKMKPAGYKDLQASDIPEVKLADGLVRVVAGTFNSIAGPINGQTTDPSYFDVHLGAGAKFAHPLPDGHNAFVYPYEGDVTIDGKPLAAHNAGVLSQNGTAEVVAGAGGARFLFIAGKPLNEPVVQYGPFVMNSPQEIEQAIRDYQNGTLARAA